MALAGVDGAQAAQGASGTKTITASIAGVNIGILVALKEAAAGGGARAQTLTLLGTGV